MKSVARCLDFARLCLEESDKNKKQKFSDNDLNNAAELLVKIALKSLSIEPKPSDEMSDLMVKKIKTFIRKNSPLFDSVYPRGCDFSLLDSSATISSVIKTLKGKTSFILNLLTQDKREWLDENQLNASFRDALLCVEPRKIGEACIGLYQRYTKGDDTRAGYYLLWLIKLATRSEFTLPSINEFNQITVRQLLTEIIIYKVELTCPIRFLELLFASRLHAPDSCLVNYFEDPLFSALLNFSVDCLKSTSFDEWPSKGDIILSFLETVTYEHRLCFAHELSLSADSKTSLIGKYLFIALTASSFQEQIFHFYALKELIPTLNSKNTAIIFGKPFPEFPADTKSDLEFTRRLSFDAPGRVFVEDNLLIGLQDAKNYGGVGLPPYLLAYDMSTEKLLWGVAISSSLKPDSSPLPSTVLQGLGSAVSHIGRCGNFITLRFEESRDVFFIDAKTGEIGPTLILPFEMNLNDKLYLTPDFCWEEVAVNGSSRIVLGRIIDGKWHTFFDREANSHVSFIPLSTHLGLLDKVLHELHIFGSNSDELVINDCLSAYADKDTLYLVQTNPSQKDTCFLTLRPLTTDKNTQEAKRIFLKTANAQILKVCPNGICVLRGYYDNPIFVNPITDEVEYSFFEPIKESDSFQISNTGNIWTWNGKFHKLVKITPKGKKEMGSLTNKRSLPLIDILYVDAKEQVYFIERKGRK